MTKRANGRQGSSAASYQWLIQNGMGGRNMDARTAFFYQATINTPAMVARIPGVGSQIRLHGEGFRRKLSRRSEELPGAHTGQRGLQKISGRSFYTTRRPGPNSRQASLSPARTISAIS